MTNPERLYPCPQCQKQIHWRTDNPWRPFCSERCKLIDFGDWASERFGIATEYDDTDFDDPENSS